MDCTNLISEVKSAIGRQEDDALITDERVLQWLNDAQKDIAKKCPGLLALDMKNTESVDFTASLSYPLADFTSPLDDVTDSNRVCHVFRAWYQDGDESQLLQFLPLDDFDSSYPDPTSTDFATGKPKYFTRRGSRLEIYPIPSSSEYDKTFRLDGAVLPIDFTSTDSTESSVLEDADQLLITYGQYRAWVYIGDKDKAVIFKSLYEDMLTDYKAENDTMPQWDANIYGEWV